MAERDAFGREKGEDPLKALGWSEGTSARAVTGAASNEPARVVATAATSITHFPSNVPGGKGGPTQMPGQIDYKEKSSTALRTMLIVFGALILVAALAILGATSDSGTKSVVQTSITPGPKTTPLPTKTPVGFAAGSLLLRSNFDRALAQLRTEGSRVSTLRVAADRIDASIVTADGRIKQVQVTWKGELKRFSTTGTGFGQDNTFRLDDVFRAAPFRLARSAAGRSRRPPESVDYLVAFHFAGLSQGIGWSAFVKNGHSYSADSRGQITRQIN